LFFEILDQAYWNWGHDLDHTGSCDDIDHVSVSLLIKTLLIYLLTYLLILREYSDYELASYINLYFISVVNGKW